MRENPRTFLLWRKQDLVDAGEAALVSIAEFTEKGVFGEAFGVRLWIFLVGFKAERAADGKSEPFVVHIYQGFVATETFATDDAGHSFVLVTDGVFEAHRMPVKASDRTAAGPV
jgi:hypothetical protein